MTGETESECLKNLDEVLKWLKEVGVILKGKKCYFMRPEVEYLALNPVLKCCDHGHKISKPCVEKEGSTSLNEPIPIPSMHSILGLLNYYGRFLPSFITLLPPHPIFKREMLVMGEA